MGTATLARGGDHRLGVVVPTTRAGGYCRISSDRMGLEIGITIQRNDEADLIDRNGWTLAGFWTDNNLSATDPNVERPEYEAIMAAAEAGEIDVIVCWHMSRLWRTRKERAEGIERLKACGVSVVCVKGPTLDMTTAYGRGVAGMLGEVDTMEVEIKKERQQAGYEAAAGRGRWHGGTRGFGHVLVFTEPEPFHCETCGPVPQITPAGDGKLVCRSCGGTHVVPVVRHIRAIHVHPREAEVIQEMKRRALAGESVRSISKDLYARGVRGVNGGKLTEHAIRNILTSARISGRREYKGEIVADATWPAIITPEESDRLRRMLRTKGGTGAPRTTKRMMSGIFRCDLCGSSLAGRPDARAWRYGCLGCGKVKVNGKLADQWVRDFICTALDSDEMRQRLRKRPDADPDLYQAITEDEDELVILAREKAEKKITRAEWQAQREIIEARLEANRRKVARQTETTALSDFIGTLEQMRTRWHQFTDGQRRAVIASCVSEIRVKPATRRGPGLDPDRFEVPDGAWLL
ncbi:MAG: hypothetical protein GEV03_22310 [Streptosporangiales bacterium]|nr:hypothetical protein [Streptosporangiales bacterium]